MAAGIRASAGAGFELRGYQGAAVTVRFTARDGAPEAVCHYYGQPTQVRAS